MKTEEFRIEHEGSALQGRLAWDEGASGPRPAVLVCHAWVGRDSFACGKAELLAGLGYAGLAIDLYGNAKLGTSKEENAALMKPFLDDRKLLRSRLLAWVEAARKDPRVDPERIAAIGFCFGGLCVLDLARAGADLRGVVSFHGLLGAPEGASREAVKAKVLALHGWDDPMAAPENLLAFAGEMTAAKADWQVHAYGGTMHAFTNPNANDPGFGTVYKKEADERSWVTMQSFLEECFR